VFAITITLLVLDLHVGAAPGHLGAALAREWPHYATFAVSFLTIGIIWVSHHAQFDLVGTVDRPLLFCNLLMVVVLIPFTTGLLADHLHAGADQHIAAAVYSATLLVMGLAFFALGGRVSRQRHLLAAELSPREARHLLVHNGIGELGYALAVMLAFFSASASLAVCPGGRLLRLSQPPTAGLHRPGTLQGHRGGCRRAKRSGARSLGWFDRLTPTRLWGESSAGRSYPPPPPQAPVVA